MKTVDAIKDILNRIDLDTVDSKEAQFRFHFFKGVSRHFNQLDPAIHCEALIQAQYYGRKGGLVNDAIEFIKPEYEIYQTAYPNEYYYMSLILFERAYNLECSGRHEEATKMIRQATLYNLWDNYMYDDYDFFSYRPCSKYVISEIAEENLSLVNPKMFNDPMDTVGLEWLRNQESLSGEKDTPTTFKQHRESMQNIRVRCFARSSKLPAKDYEGKSRKRQHIHKINPLMWAHYADEHRGICIKYRFKKELFPPHSEDMSEMYRMGNAEYKQAFSLNEFDVRVEDALFAKSKIWSYEHESRLVYCSIHDIPDVKIVPIPGAIKAIYFGLRCSKEDENIIRALVTGRDIELYRMFTDINNVYKPKIRRIY